MDWHCNADRILVQPITSEEMAGGLFIPDTSTNLKKGIVVQVGTGKKVKIGDTVQYKPEDGTPVTLDDESYLLMFEHHVWMYKP